MTKKGSHTQRFAALMQQYGASKPQRLWSLEARCFKACRYFTEDSPPLTGSLCPDGSILAGTTPVTNLVTYQLM